MTTTRPAMLAVPAMFAVLACSGSVGAPDAGGEAVTRGSIATRLLLTGELIAEEAERLVVPNANIWPVQIRWLAEDGIEVRRGDPLVEFDNSQLTANLEQLRAAAIEAGNRLSSRRAQVAAEEAAAAFEVEQRRAEADKAGIAAAVPESVIGGLQYQQHQLTREKAQLALAESEAKLTATRRAKAAEIEVETLTLAKTRARVERSQSRIDFLTLRASRDGILIFDDHRREGRPLQLGDAVFPGWVVGRLPDLSTMIVAARLFDVDDGQIAPGMEVAVTLDAFPELTFPGKVREIDAIADQASSRSLRRFFDAKIDLERIDMERMRPGMSVKVLIETHHDGVLLVPRSCLDWGEEGPRARLADGSWKALALGACDAEACVVESGLEESVALARVDRGRAAEGRG